MKRKLGENCSYGKETAVGIVMQLFIDDGVPSRGHRTNLMNADFREVGIFAGPHKEFRIMCV